MARIGFRKYTRLPEYVENGIFARDFVIYMQDQGINGKFYVADLKIPLPTNDMARWKRN